MNIGEALANGWRPLVIELVHEDDGCACGEQPHLEDGNSAVQPAGNGSIIHTRNGCWFKECADA